MNPENKKLLNLALNALEKGELIDADRKAFSRDHKKYANEELSFRELMETIKKPTGDLKKALISYYAASNYTRVFR